MEACPVCTFDEFLYPLECCTHKLCLKCLKGVCLHAGTCPCCRAELSAAFKMRIDTKPSAIRDVGDDIHDRIQAMLAAGAAWAYGDRKNKCCWLYDENTQREIKAATDAGASTVIATACGCAVTIDVIRKTQENHSTRAMRCIRVVSDDAAAIKGIAGMPRASRQWPRAHLPTSMPSTAARAATESLADYRARIFAAFISSHQTPQEAGEKKVAFNRRVREWAAQTRQL